MWAEKSYPSRKPLMSYHKDLIKRINMFTSWIEQGTPVVFWIPGFYFTQSFFTGVRQNYARKKKTPIDKIEFVFEVRTQKSESKAPEVGCYVHGMYIEGNIYCIWSIVHLI